MSLWSQKNYISTSKRIVYNHSESSSNRNGTDALLIDSSSRGGVKDVIMAAGRAIESENSKSHSSCGSTESPPPFFAVSENHLGQLSGLSTKQYEPHSINPPPAAPLYQLVPTQSC